MNRLRNLQPMGEVGTDDDVVTETAVLFAIERGHGGLTVKR